MAQRRNDRFRFDPNVGELVFEGEPVDPDVSRRLIEDIQSYDVTDPPERIVTTYHVEIDGHDHYFETEMPGPRTQPLFDAARSRRDTLQGELRSAGIDLIEIDATSSVVDPLLAFFRMRERRSRR